MKEINWGKLVARALGASMIIDGAGRWSVFLGSPGPDLGLSFVAQMSIPIIAGVLLFAFSGVFAKPETEDESGVEASVLASVVLAGLSAYVGLTYANGVIREIVTRGTMDEAGSPLPVWPLMFNIVVFAGCAAVVMNSRTVVRWLSR